MEKKVKVDAASLLRYLRIFCILKMQKVFLRGAWEIVLACKAAWGSRSRLEEEWCSG